MNRNGYLLFLGVTVSIGALISSGAGCSSSSTGSSTGGGTTTKSTTTGSGGHTSSSSGGTGGGTTSSSGGTGGGTVTLDCTSYCGEIMANCTGNNAQYTSNDSCMGVCAGFTAMGMLADTSGDTLGCRIYHAGAAKSDPVTHCPHAGPTGGDKDPMGTAGTCGEPCTSFCSIQAKVCTGSNQQFGGDMTACMTACKGFKADTAAYNDMDTSKNDMGCRFYHLSAAASSAANAMTHCPHIVTASAVCTM